jgi:hypothetical protein
MTPQPVQADKNQGWYVGAGVGEYNASLDVVDSEYRNTVFQFFGGSHGPPQCGRQFEPSEDRSWPPAAGLPSQLRTFSTKTRGAQLGLTVSDPAPMEPQWNTDRQVNARNRFPCEILRCKNHQIRLASIEIVSVGRDITFVFAGVE